MARMVTTKKAETTAKTASVKATPAKSVATASVETTTKETETAKVTAVKEEKPVEKETAAKKPAAKKTTTRKTAAKKATVETEVFVQFWGKEVVVKDIVENIKKVWTEEMGKKEADMKDLKVYIKPEDNGAHYVINGDITGFVGL